MLNLCKTILLLLLVIHLSNGSLDSNLLTLYDLKVKNNEPTCRLLNHANLPEDRRTLAGRGCMCDEECIKYRDCCQDSPYYRANEQSLPPSHHCAELTAVYMKAECPSEWEDSDIRQLCEKSTKPLDNDDFSTIMPVSNVKNREVYGNIHCAACHNDADDENWIYFPIRPLALCEAPPGYVKKTIKYRTETTTTNKPTCHKSTPSPPAKYISPITSNELKEELNTENCNHNCQVKVINNILTHPPPGIKLDIHLYVYNDTTIGGGEQQWPVELKTIVPDDIEARFSHLSDRRDKRNARYAIDIEKYWSKVEEICSNAGYDEENKVFVSRYDNKDFFCFFGAVLPENATLFTRRCVPQMERKCPDGYENETIKKECSVYTNVVYGIEDKKPFRNKDCARCNGKKEKSVDGTPPQQTRNDLSNVAENTNEPSKFLIENPTIMHNDNDKFPRMSAHEG